MKPYFVIHAFPIPTHKVNCMYFNSLMFCLGENVIVIVLIAKYLIMIVSWKVVWTGCEMCTYEYTLSMHECP